MLKFLSRIFSPLSNIADELRAIRELYEADLASRKIPVYRITEEPGKKDTAVFYGVEEEDKKSMKERLIDMLSLHTSEDD